MSDDLTPEEAADALVAAVHRQFKAELGRDLNADQVAGCALLQLLEAAERAHDGKLQHLTGAAFMLGLQVSAHATPDLQPGVARLLKQRISEGLGRGRALGRASLH